MTVVTEMSEIRTRVAQRRQQEGSGVDLWVTLEGQERHEAASAVEAAASRCSREDMETWEVYPTTGGTYVWLEGLTTWEARVQQLAAELERLGHAGVISAAPVEAWPSPASKVPYPTAVMAHRMDPPVTEGPFNAMGMPQYRWGVPERTTRLLLERAVDWVCLPDTVTWVTAFAPVPVTTDDAAEILDLMMGRGARNLRLQARPVPDTGIRRTVLFESFGESVWCDADADADPVAVAEALTRRIVDLAPDLDVAVVHPTFPGANETHYVTSGIWNRNRHLWSSFVPDAFGIQLLTGAHLRRAHDLSAWRVEEVAPDRWIVQARDLAAWFAVSDALAFRQQRFPSPEVRAQARQDFGEMILTRAAAKAHPRPTPGR